MHFKVKMIYLQQILLLAFSLNLLESISCERSKTKEDLLNWCLDSKNHKAKPGKEDSLNQQCSPWKDHACCTEEVTINIHQTDMYNFTLDHCYEKTGDTDLKMTDKCRRHFIQDNCFYECEPHIGLWVVNVTRKISNERFYQVPLCASDCDQWFEDCKGDFTCAYNWPRDFTFSKGRNYCKEIECQNFSLQYRTAKDFCENVWDHSWKYTPDDQPCMHIWFDNSKENPNRKVAEYYIDKRFHPDGAQHISLSYILHIFMFGFTYYVSQNVWKF